MPVFNISFGNRIAQIAQKTTWHLPYNRVIDRPSIKSNNNLYSIPEFLKSGFLFDISRDIRFYSPTRAEESFTITNRKDMWQFLEQIDIDIFYFINQGCRNALFDMIMPVASRLKYFIIPIILCWLFLITKKNLKYRMIAIMILVMIGVADWTNYRIRLAINRPRPYHSLSAVRRNVSSAWQVTPVLSKKIYGKSFSFPSSHAVNTFAAAFFLSYYFRSLIPFVYFLAFIISLSRIYVGDHFPFDVIAGSLLGTFWAALFVWINNRAIQWVKKKIYQKKQDCSAPE